MDAESKPLCANSRFRVVADRVEQGMYAARALSAVCIESNYPMDALADGAPPGPVRMWQRAADLSLQPQLVEGGLLWRALYNLSLEELAADTATDDATGQRTFDAGAKWPGVWTRDVSYSILLSLAMLEPETSKTSLRKKVRRGRIVQDTGTGGSWPVSTDRLIWGVAAWEIFLVTGDSDWLAECYPVLRDSVRDDLEVAVDAATGLLHGETSFLDWRDQTYPRWMQPADIFQSFALSTNSVFYRCLRVLQAMCAELHEPAAEWAAAAERAKASLNTLFWQPEHGSYGAYRYGAVYLSLSPRADALGSALTILFGGAPPDRQDQVLRTQPVVEFGVPAVFPQSPGIPPYHNDAVWPFVEAFWTLAASRYGDEAMVGNGLAALERAAALFLTNKENFVASTGTAAGTQVNSDRQLWSVAGMLAMTFRVLLGMRFELDGLHFAPVVPPGRAPLTLAGFHYREAVLDIEVSGSGGTLVSFELDGHGCAPHLPPTLSGWHRVAMRLSSTASSRSGAPVADAVAPDTPVVTFAGDTLAWEGITGAAVYEVFRNGTLVLQTADRRLEVHEEAYAEYQVSAMNTEGNASFLSAPVSVGAAPRRFAVCDERGELPFVEIAESGVTGVAIPVEMAAGPYAVRFCYSNGAGPVNTENRCAVRTLFLDGERAGTVVMPQRGTGCWDDFGYSSRVLLRVKSAGQHTLELRLLPADANMSGEENRARVQSVELLRLP